MAEGSFTIRRHPIDQGANTGWQLVGPDDDVWCSGPPETRQRMIGLISLLSAAVQLGGAAAEWAQSLVESGAAGEPVLHSST